MNPFATQNRRIFPQIHTDALQRFSICAAAVLLSACANFKGIEPSAHTNDPAEYATTTSLPGQGGMWPDSAWVTSIGGPQLQQLMDEAIANNPNLQAAVARVAAAKAMTEAAGAAAKPQVGASLSSTRERFTENTIYPPPYGGSYATDNEFGISASYDLDFWNKHGAELQAALSHSKAAEAEHYAARLMLTTTIAKAWVQLARQYAQLNLTDQQLVLRDKLDSLTRQRFTAGLDTQSDNQQSRQQIANLRAEKIQWNESIALSRNQIAALLGKGPDRGLSLPQPSLPADMNVALPEQLPLCLLGRRADIVAARWQV